MAARVKPPEEEESVILRRRDRGECILFVIISSRLTLFVQRPEILASHFAASDEKGVVVARRI